MQHGDGGIDEAAVREFTAAGRRLEETIGQIVVGQHDVVRQVLIAVLAGGHVLLEGVPGLGKTLLVRTLGQALNLHFSRVQFTPDLMPADITGTNIINEDEGGRRAFSFQAGPLFANVVLADEINRATPKTQSALLEAMQERTVTVGGETRVLPRPFFVLATQNPLEMEGTYPLPEAQLDRFLFKISVEYASSEAERDIVLRHHRGFRPTDLEAAGVEPVVDLAGVLDLRAQVAAVRVDDSVAEYAVALARATRTAPEAQYGASVRGAIGLVAASKAVAAFAGRAFVTPDDVKSVAAAVLRHRVVLKAEAELDGVRPDDLVARILANVPVPR